MKMVVVRAVADFETWYRKEHPRLVAALTVATGNVDVARDLVSEAFARALERWDRVAEMESPTGWARQVAMNLLRRHYRRASLEERILRRHPPVASALPDGPIDPVLWATVLALPPRQRAVLALRIVLDLSQEETAALLGIKPGTVSATLVDARRAALRTLTTADHSEPKLPEANHG
jgi:RNA polymerase sigma-70 factor (ECF subfamily)